MNHTFHPNDVAVPGLSLAAAGGMAILAGLRQSAADVNERLSDRLSVDQFESALAVQDLRINQLVDRVRADDVRINKLLLELEVERNEAKRWKALASA